MKWYNYLACFLAGVFLIHLVPHLLNGLRSPMLSARWSASAAGLCCDLDARVK
jgi:hypothetical protein